MWLANAHRVKSKKLRDKAVVAFWKNHGVKVQPKHDLGNQGYLGNHVQLRVASVGQ